MIRIGLLGCGRIAKRRSHLLRGGHIAEAKRVAVCAEVRDWADAMAARFDVATHYRIDDLLARKDTDAVSVLTSSAMLS
ncbi:hypothetical protein JQ620_29430 [Bradyrhizobium sp. AUGA SZCCT0274]|uniref:Gfo/Idh/MocA family oxidoreductase n=1 Tax=Bradyrhizobium sp. AUGA SZCCT0274 TaxID=2807670 RepID=UPI001BA57072|nr:Gfo/Idh/MocA family oxidoreductase [Bradyrhizobium sp. AUGA SZCCT0274]MBR1244220.1 hypothetical protein [Bradyrhizobium sp. AUGA SZCCT0274]